MSGWIDVDSCPCKTCNDTGKCDNDVVPWCEKYSSWYMEQKSAVDGKSRKEESQCEKS